MLVLLAELLRGLRKNELVLEKFACLIDLIGCKENYWLFCHFAVGKRYITHLLLLTLSDHRRLVP